MIGAIFSDFQLYNGIVLVCLILFVLLKEMLCKIVFEVSIAMLFQ